jgi:hypothetical protein
MFYGSFIVRFFGVLFLWILKNTVNFFKKKRYIPFKQISNPPIEDPVDLLGRGLILNIIGIFFLLFIVFVLGRIITWFMYVNF